MRIVLEHAHRRLDRVERAAAAAEDRRPGVERARSAPARAPASLLGASASRASIAPAPPWITSVQRHARSLSSGSGRGRPARCAAAIRSAAAASRLRARSDRRPSIRRPSPRPGCANSAQRRQAERQQRVHRRATMIVWWIDVEGEHRLGQHRAPCGGRGSSSARRADQRDDRAPALQLRARRRNRSPSQRGGDDVAGPGELDAGDDGIAEHRQRPPPASTSARSPPSPARDRASAEAEQEGGEIGEMRDPVVDQRPASRAPSVEHQTWTEHQPGDRQRPAPRQPPNTRSNARCSQPAAATSSTQRQRQRCRPTDRRRTTDGSRSAATTPSSAPKRK